MNSDDDLKLVISEADVAAAGDGAEGAEEADGQPASAAAPSKAAPTITFDLGNIKMITDNYLDTLGEEEETKVKKKKRMSRKERKEKKRQQKIANTKIVMRDHLLREVDLTKKTAAKIMFDWEGIIKSIRLTEMREELEAWAQQIKRQVSMQDELIKTTIEDIDHTIELSSKSYQQYTEMTKFMHDTFRACVDGVTSCYQTESTDIVKNFQEGLRCAEEHLNKQKLNYEKRIHALGAEAENTLKLDQEIFTLKKEDIINESIVRRYEIRDCILSKMKVLQKRLTDFVDEIYAFNTNDRYEKTHALVSKHLLLNRDRLKNNRLELQKMQELHAIEDQCLNIELKTEHKLNNLQAEYKYFAEVRYTLWSMIDDEREETYQKLKLVTCTTEDLIKKYKEYVKEGELLLSLTARCRKFQTQAEKIVHPTRETSYYENEETETVYPACATIGLFSSPSTSSTLTDDIFHLRTLSMKDHLDMTEHEYSAQEKLFEFFWRRVALVEAQVLLLKDEKARLNRENKRIIEFIKSLGHTDDLSKLRQFLQVQAVSSPQSEYTCPNGKLSKYY